MGGKALKIAYTRRYQREEFDELSKEMREILYNNFDKVDIPFFYKKKESFGDIDILVSGGIKPMREYIEETFKPTEIFDNGNCWSFDYKEIQVDLITCSIENFDTNFMYLSYNDLGNYMGRIAQGFGLKYGTTGLWYEHYFKNQNIGSVPVSKDYSKIFEFLGLDYTRWEEGFDTLEDIFKFIAYSPFFNWEMYQLASLNKINRDRNAKRASYMSFLAWIAEHVMGEFHQYKFEENKTLYITIINDTFPEANITKEIRKLEYLECRKLYCKSKFSGVMRKYGFQGKELGAVMDGYKKFVNYDETIDIFDDFIIKSTESYIYEDFEYYLKYKNISIPLQNESENSIITDHGQGAKISTD